MAEYNPYADYHRVDAGDDSFSAMRPLRTSQHFPPRDSQDDKYYTPKSAAGHAYYPLSLLILAVWVGFIVAEVYLLERAVALGPTALSLPWYYSTTGLPTVLLTVFAQAHGPITAMHLSRLAISALQTRRHAPRTWIELFWLTDMSWAGPVGILATAWSALWLRVRVSALFLLFCLLSVVALVTPIMLDRAYPIHTVDVRQSLDFAPSTLTPAKLDSIDAYAQLAAGGGTWTTTLPVLDIFNRTTFTPVGSAREAESSDLFFAGDVEGMDTRLPGVRIQGGCQAMDGQGDLSDPDAFTSFCHGQLPGAMPNFHTLAPNSLRINYSYCSNLSFAGFNSPSYSLSYIWFNNTQVVQLDKIVVGLMRCNVCASTGDASVYGRTLAFDHFVANNSLYNSSQGGENLLDPMYAAMYHLGQVSGSDDTSAQVIDSLGYSEVGNNFTSPSLSQLADAMWRGGTHMAAAMALLSRSSDTVYPAISHTPVSARTRNRVFFIVAMALLLVWAVGMAVLTVLLWRKSAADSLDSYAAARLVADRPDLVRGVAAGGPADNPRLLEKFRKVEEFEAR